MILDRPEFVNFKYPKFPMDSYGFDVVELKMDGWWSQLLLEGSVWQNWSRSGLLKDEGVLCTPCARTLLHGEYLYGTQWSKDRPHLYGKIALFGITESDGQSMMHLTNKEMRERVELYVRQLTNEYVGEGVFIVPQWPVSEAPRLWEEYVLGKGYEGLVFKRSSGLWTEGFGRMKRAVTMDYVVVGFEPSDSDTYIGWGVKSILGGLYYPSGELVHVCNVSGITADERAEFFQHPEKYVGRVFEAEGKKLGKDGALRHPNVKRNADGSILWRDDKRPAECTWDTSNTEE